MWRQKIDFLKKNKKGGNEEIEESVYPPPKLVLNLIRSSPPLNSYISGIGGARFYYPTDMLGYVIRDIQGKAIKRKKVPRENCQPHTISKRTLRLLEKSGCFEIRIEERNKNFEYKCIRVLEEERELN